MAKIRLPQRTELPPSRVGKAKPSFSLADRSGQKRLGQVVSKFSGSIFDQLVNARAANEEAEAIGQVNTLLEGWETLLADKPNASFEELQKERDKIMGNIKKVSQQPTTGIAKDSMTNWMARNEGIISARLQTSMEKIQSKNELTRYRVQRENFINNMDKNGLASLNSKMTSPEAGLLDPETTKFQQEQDFQVIDKAQEEMRLSQLKSGIEAQAFAIAAEQGLPAAEKLLRDPATTSQLIEAGVPREDIRGLLNDVEERVKFQAEQEKAALDQKREEDRDNIYDAINTGSVTLPNGTVSTDLRSYIESTSLDEDEQENMYQKAIKENDRKLKGLDIITNPRVRSQLYKDTMGILTGAQARDDILNRAAIARFGDYSDPKNPIEPTLNDVDYKSLTRSINAQYEQGFGQMMSKVNDYAEGILLKTDSLGFVRNAPVREKSFGDFQEAWMQLVASKGDKLKISDIYPEGRRLAASFQISDDEAARLEDEINFELQQRESKARMAEILGREPTLTDIRNAELMETPPPDFFPAGFDPADDTEKSRAKRLKQWKKFTKEVAKAIKASETNLELPLSDLRKAESIEKSEEEKPKERQRGVLSGVEASDSFKRMLKELDRKNKKKVTGAPVLVSTQAEYNELASGTRYVDRNGSIGVKQ